MAVSLVPVSSAVFDKHGVVRYAVHKCIGVCLELLYPTIITAIKRTHTKVQAHMTCSARL